MGQFTLRSFLYSYVIAPIRTIEISPQIRPINASLLIIFLFSLGSNLGINLSPGKTYFLTDRRNIFIAVSYYWSRKHE